MKVKGSERDLQKSEGRRDEGEEEEEQEVVEG